MLVVCSFVAWKGFLPLMVNVAWVKWVVDLPVFSECFPLLVLPDWFRFELCLSWFHLRP